jgi:hypothetical protein
MRLSMVSIMGSVAVGYIILRIMLRVAPSSVMERGAIEAV